ncbi:hypothetical protein CIL05_12485 [Virgibacillus profundi]|uniref:Phosphatidylinositol kinase n=1 Tax=Virgibacillus profundi TaxID=2024555 RepID=A0A2A2ICV6_9BACI|nr:hypothetical protein [Virgibacillus profundi]PAV29208.1 hypothetical protein CIL05_12485 [Virgibacillus profundi]PXY53377.1 hypothetical protein CIT14_12610 [Virgibacillus profundi]
MKNDYHHIYDLCKKHMHSYVLAEMVDGSKLDGIITGLDEEYVYFAVPIDQNQHQSPDYPPNENDRQFGYGYPGYGYGYPGYGYGRPPRRFNRLILPLAALTALTVLPWY